MEAVFPFTGKNQSLHFYYSAPLTDNAKVLMDQEVLHMVTV